MHIQVGSGSGIDTNPKTPYRVTATRARAYLDYMIKGDQEKDAELKPTTKPSREFLCFILESIPESAWEGIGGPGRTETAKVCRESSTAVEVCKLRVVLKYLREEYGKDR